MPSFEFEELHLSTFVIVQIAKNQNAKTAQKFGWPEYILIPGTSYCPHYQP
jgi:hypothetical protein